MQYPTFQLFVAVEWTLTGDGLVLYLCTLNESKYFHPDLSKNRFRGIIPENDLFSERM